MKYESFIRDDELLIKIESDVAKDIYEIINIAQQIKKPVRAIGSITTNGAYVWIGIPIKKRDYKITDIGNYK